MIASKTISNTPLNVFLFDVDGVLVDPRGYVAGMIKTLEMLRAKHGVPKQHSEVACIPNEKDIKNFEAIGIHDVWDATCILFAILNCDLDLNEFITHTKNQTLAGAHPPQVALKVLSELCPEKNPLLTSILTDTRDVYKNYITRTCQNIILGSKEFENCYKLKSEIDGESLLTTLDTPLLSKNSADTVLKLTAEHKIYAALYTARPSRPPIGDTAGYSPEAELAAHLVGLAKLPLVGMGTMQWLAKEAGLQPEELTKPNTTQALSAIIAALNGGDIFEASKESLKITRGECEFNQSFFSSYKNHCIQVFVFEDTVAGLIPLKKIEQLFADNGFNLTLIAYGIAKNDDKKTSLKPYCKEILRDTNKAIELALRTLK